MKSLKSRSRTSVQYLACLRKTKTYCGRVMNREPIIVIGHPIVVTCIYTYIWYTVWYNIQHVWYVSYDIWYIYIITYIQSVYIQEVCSWTPGHRKILCSLPSTQEPRSSTLDDSWFLLLLIAKQLHAQPSHVRRHLIYGPKVKGLSIKYAWYVDT